MSEQITPAVINRYSSIIASIANNAITKTDGATQERGLVKYKFGLSTLKDRNIHVYIDNEVVVIDMYINVDFGYSVPDVVCSLQERIKKEVEENTRFEVKKINVNVVNVNFN